jgi:PqqA peptide cyclase
MPCHACETIPGIEVDNIRNKKLADIWINGSAFNKYRGTSWMKEPCRSCDRREIDWGGCRCQALAVTGDPCNADPACALSDWHQAFADIADQESHAPAPPFIYRRIGVPAER